MTYYTGENPPVKIHYWWTPCCEEDMNFIKSEKDLEDCIEYCREGVDADMGIEYFTNLKEMLKEYPTCKWWLEKINLIDRWRELENKK